MNGVNFLINKFCYLSIFFCFEYSIEPYPNIYTCSLTNKKQSKPNIKCHQIESNSINLIFDTWKYFALITVFAIIDLHL